MNIIQKLLTGASLTCVALSTAGSASAATITALTGFSTTGSDMNGMEVTVNFQNGTSSTAIWSTISPEIGAASNGDWALSESGNTFGGLWTFSNNTGSTISSLFINAIAGKTVFDIDPSSDDAFSTDGSADGIKFKPNLGLAPTSFEYGNIVNLAGNAPVGDLYAELNLFWKSGFASGSSLQFVADTDNATFVVDPTSPKPVPVPGAVFGVVLAAAAFGGKALKKRQDQHN